eukprot:8295166-Lingulodinium_polyedra.AAC.1
MGQYRKGYMQRFSRYGRMDGLEARAAFTCEPAGECDDGEGPRGEQGDTQGPLEVCADLAVQAREVRSIIHAK